MRIYIHNYVRNGFKPFLARAVRKKESGAVPALFGDTVGKESRKRKTPCGQGVFIPDL
jgi:hypothetical protein